MLTSFLQLGSSGRDYYPDSATRIKADIWKSHEPRPGLNQIQTTAYHTENYRPGDETEFGNERGGFLFTLSADGSTISNITMNGQTLLSLRMTVQKINNDYYMVFINDYTVGTVFDPIHPTEPFNWWQTSCYRSDW